MPKPLELDGRHLEGGGQLVRVALTLSALCRIPIRITRIRGNRASRNSSGGGLKESHLAALRVLQRWCGADAEGDFVGSTETVFVPGRSPQGALNGNEETIVLQRPGSVWLVLQALLPFVLFGGLVVRTATKGKSNHRSVERADGAARSVCLRLKGGTNVSKSMSGEYVQQVLLPVLEKIGLPKVELQILKRGWAGNAPDIGEVLVTIPVGEEVKPMDGLQVEGRGKLQKIDVSVVSGRTLFDKYLHDSIDTLARTVFPASMFASGTQDINLSHFESGDERRLYIILVARTENGWRLGRDYLGTGKACKDERARKTLADTAATAAITGLRHELERGGCVDEFMHDQLVVFQALAKGWSFVEAGPGRGKGTLHTQTVRWVCEEMLGRRGVRFEKDGGCEGVGWPACELNEAFDDVEHDLCEPRLV